MSGFYSRWKRPLIRTKVLSGLQKYSWYLRDLRKYSKMAGAEPIKLVDTYPRLFDKTSKTRLDSHYFYQSIWAFSRILQHKPEKHIDVGSDVDFVGYLSTITEVEFVDIRPLKVSNIPSLKSIKGSILEMPYDNNSLKSISCLHVAEHIGLGRYGDELDPLGTKKAAAELSRCLAKGGNLYFSVPVGRAKLHFNAHRIHSPRQILDYFSGLKLVEFSGTDDNKNFIENAELNHFESQRYACGMFQFTKES